MPNPAKLPLLLLTLLLTLTPFACTTLPSTSTTDPQIKVYQLKFSRASTLAKIINDVFNGTHSGTPSTNARNIRATFADETNYLVVAAPFETLETIDSIIEQFDNNPGEGPATFIYPLKHVSAVDLQPHLTAIFNARIPYGLESQSENDQFHWVFITAEPHTNSFLVESPTFMIERVKTLIDALDIPARRPDPNP